MKKTITLNTFRRMDRDHEAMIRSMMPATSEASPEPLAPRATSGTVIRTVNGLRLVAKPLTFTIGEVANA